MNKLGVFGGAEVLNVGGLEHSATQQGPTPRVFPDTMGMVSRQPFAIAFGTVVFCST